MRTQNVHSVRELFFVLLLIIGSCGTVEADPLSQWSWVSHSPTGNDLHALAFGDGLFVAAGDYGTILTSSDGDHWQPQVPATDRHIWSLAYGNGVFVASLVNFQVGSPLTLLYSRDGTRWGQRSIGSRHSSAQVEFAGSLFFVPVPYFDEPQQKRLVEVFVSRDGIEWPDSPSFTLEPGFGSVSFYKGTYIATGAGYGLLWISSDGFHWQRVENGIPNAYFNSITSNANMLVAVGGKLLKPMAALLPAIWTSPDGITWTESFSSFAMSSDRLISGGGRHLSFGGWYPPQIWTSSDGIGWQQVPQVLPTGGNPLRSAAYGRSRFIAVGEYGTIISSGNTTNWHSVSKNLEGEKRMPALTSITYGHGLFVANDFDRNHGTNRIITSPDLTNWTERFRLPHALPATLSFVNGLFVATGTEGLFASTNGITWRTAIPDWDPRHALYANGKFMAFSEGRVAFSEDGQLWSEPAQIQANARCIAFGKGLFIAGGSGGLWSSTNAIDWAQTYRDELFSPSVIDAAYGSGRFVVVSYDTILTSEDGLNWSRFEQGFEKIVYANGAFVAFANRSYSFARFEPARAELATSIDGVTWTPRLKITAGLGDLLFANNTFYAVGGGVILQSALVGPRLSARISPTGVFESKLLAEPGYTYEIQTSTDLKHWSPAGSITNDQRFGSKTLDGRQLFYRASQN